MIVFNGVTISLSMVEVTYLRAALTLGSMCVQVSYPHRKLANMTLQKLNDKLAEVEED